MKLGRKQPTDWEHYERYALTPATAPIKPTPVVLGIDWYSSFNNPVRKYARWWIGLDLDKLGSIQGGHAIAVESGGYGDLWHWRLWYNQDRNSCVGFSTSRVMSLLNRRKYDANWLYDQALKIDEWPGEADEGTSVRAGLEVLRTLGHRWVTGDKTRPEHIDEGISAYRWMSSAVEVRSVLKNPRADRIGAVPLLNSWGTSYPQRVWLPDEALDFLLSSRGEAGTVTDR
jgi:hypothetical protein